MTDACICVCAQGFLVNRVLIPMINEAFYCLMEVRVGPTAKLSTAQHHGVQRLRRAAAATTCSVSLPHKFLAGVARRFSRVCLKLVALLCPGVWCVVFGWDVQNVGTAEDIDKGLRLGTNQPMGPLRLADFIGEAFLLHVGCAGLVLVVVCV